ncbi:MAG: oxidoreductase domain protein [Frankiales bacterium]|jgi:predicted dehydrogenase|nr:oxidoreductase domain protein [Frankiales bacterium]
MWPCAVDSHTPSSSLIRRRGSLAFSIRRVTASSPLRLRLVSPDGSTGHPLAAYLQGAGAVLVREPTGRADAVVVLDPSALAEHVEDALLAGTSRGTPVLLVGPRMSTALTDAAGLVPGPVLPVHVVRVRPGKDAGEVTARLGADELLLTDCWPLQEKVADDVEVVLTANRAFRDHPVATWRPATAVATLTVGSTSETLADPAFHRIVHRLVRHVVGHRDAAPVRVGMLGYGAIGHEHALAIQATAGLELAAVCDPNPARLQAARQVTADVRGHADGADLLADDGVDLVIVSTPPDTHADQALRALRAGKHVVVEKPFCLTVEQADRQIAAAAEAGLTLAVYQNRRWDVDYLALKAAVRAGRLGEVFHLESFVGGHDHPCNFWHSDEAISGGAIYDWGSHYLDWVLDLFSQQVAWVSATAHKRLWHDVTNADHTRVLVHFVDGVEAEFTHSDLAAARKPKFYVLGTQGAIVGAWRSERLVSRSPIGLLVEDHLAASDSPATLTLHAAGGDETLLAVPPAPQQPFHRELADQLLSGEPMSVTPAGSRRNIAVMEAATRSAADDGRPVVPAL